MNAMMVPIPPTPMTTITHTGNGGGELYGGGGLYEQGMFNTDIISPVPPQVSFEFAGHGRLHPTVGAGSPLRTVPHQHSTDDALSPFSNPINVKLASWAMHAAEHVS